MLYPGKFFAKYSVMGFCRSEFFISVLVCADNLITISKMVIRISNFFMVLEKADAKLYDDSVGILKNHGFGRKNVGRKLSGTVQRDLNG